MNSLKIKIKPIWEEIDIVREQVNSFLTKNNFKQETVYAMVMTASELVENAVKYGADNLQKDKITISVDILPREIIIEVKNKIKPENRKEMKMLDETIQWIRGFQDHFEAYLDKLKHVSTKKLAEGESGLGLVRIAYEGRSILDFYINENNILAMSAVYKI
ncbi:MAG: ATP-binding protein [Spirochaetia bacterium]|nr:ATP-binding protein [Spirochaetia bacterium]